MKSTQILSKKAVAKDQTPFLKC